MRKSTEFSPSENSFRSEQGRYIRRGVAVVMLSSLSVVGLSTLSGNHGRGHKIEKCGKGEGSTVRATSDPITPDYRDDTDPVELARFAHSKEIKDPSQSSSHDLVDKIGEIVCKLPSGENVIIRYVLFIRDRYMNKVGN